ncbi:hypothetical protein AVEN_266301-1 [Araneus ventricosus]|uniref:Uncharacterized protein n=1 Tax=Araneus ventricosus TaxID=182803 RepID=A0A4Y2ED70_ARAVE|nr:hypothetical protein AVEN_266301-1 [Araneus ventricosus]
MANKERLQQLLVVTKLNEHAAPSVLSTDNSQNINTVNATTVLRCVWGFDSSPRAQVHFGTVLLSIWPRTRSGCNSCWCRPQIRMNMSAPSVLSTDNSQNINTVNDTTLRNWFPRNSLAI